MHVLSYDLPLWFPYIGPYPYHLHSSLPIFSHPTTSSEQSGSWALTRQLMRKNSMPTSSSMVFTPSTLTLLICLTYVVCFSLPNIGHSNTNNYKTITRAHILQALHYSSSFIAFKQTWKKVTKGQRTSKFILGVPYYKPYFHTLSHYWGGSKIVDIKMGCVSQSVRKQCYSPYDGILKEVCLPDLCSLSTFCEKWISIHRP